MKPRETDVPPWESWVGLGLTLAGLSDEFPSRDLTDSWLYSELLLEVLHVQGRAVNFHRPPGWSRWVDR